MQDIAPTSCPIIPLGAAERVTLKVSESLTSGPTICPVQSVQSTSSISGSTAMSTSQASPAPSRSALAPLASESLILPSVSASAAASISEVPIGVSITSPTSVIPASSSLASPSSSVVAATIVSQSMAASSSGSSSSFTTSSLAVSTSEVPSSSSASVLAQNYQRIANPPARKHLVVLPTLRLHLALRPSQQQPAAVHRQLLPRVNQQPSPQANPRRLLQADQYLSLRVSQHPQQPIHLPHPQPQAHSASRPKPKSSSIRLSRTTSAAQAHTPPRGSLTATSNPTPTTPTNPTTAPTSLSSKAAAQPPHPYGRLWRVSCPRQHTSSHTIRTSNRHRRRRSASSRLVLGIKGLWTLLTARRPAREGIWSALCHIRLRTVLQLWFSRWLARGLCSWRRGVILLWMQLRWLVLTMMCGEQSGKTNGVRFEEGGACGRVRT